MDGMAAVLLLLLSALSSAGGSDGRDLLRPKLAWNEQLLPLSRGALDASGSQAKRVAQTAVDYLNYAQGSPSSIRALGHVRKASLKSISGVGRKYILHFSTKNIQTGNLGRCLATVLYMKKKLKPMVDISCINEKDTDQRMKDDYKLYVEMKENNTPSLAQLKLLASIGSSYIAWEKSTEDVGYTLSKIKDMKQLKNDNALEFDYTVLLNSDVSETLSCHMRVIWKLELPIKVKYDCSAEDASVESADGSGEEPGSSSEFFIGSNF